MFVYMSKKIAIPKHASVSCLAWNHRSGYIAVGGDDGMLKVLKLEAGGGGNLSMNLSLEGHSGQLRVATWNEEHQKLTTSDQHGVIIVWMLYKGSWYEEMINNRNKSTVSSMAWSSDGQKICIAYEDGAVILGSVDGSRIWGKDVKGPGLSAVQWSPDNTLLLFALTTGELHLYDNQGNFAMSLAVQCAPVPTPIVGMHWYSGQANVETPTLVVCYKNGRLQLMKNHNDDGVIIIDSGLQAVSCYWNHNGSAFAVAGVDSENINSVQFFTPFGEHMRTLRVPNGGLQMCVWEGRSLRVAIAVDSFIYFANVKPDYKKSYFGNTLVFSNSQNTLTFWDTSTNQFWVNHVQNVVDISAINDYCVVATAHSLVIYNQQGIQCDAKITPMEISYVAMNSFGSVVAASKDCFMLWSFVSSDPNSKISNVKDDIFYPDGTPCLGEFQSSQDPICCLAYSDKLLLIGRESGNIISYHIPTLTNSITYKLSKRPYKLAINSNSSKFAIIDTMGGFYMVDSDSSTINNSVRKDVWGILWASDNPQLIAIMEKARLYILKNGEPEEPLPAHGYLCHFQELEIICAKLSEIGEQGDSEFLVKLEVKSLRDTKQLIEKVGLKEAEAFIQDNPHPKLWRLLAEASLRKLDLTSAELAYVRCGDYAGIQLVKRLSALRGTALRSAEVLACFKQFDEAEKIYLQEDRRDLAIALRQRLGHWFRVVELLKMSTNTSEEQLKEAYNNIGHFYVDRQNWTSAREYFSLAGNRDGLVKCYIALEDIDALKQLKISSPKNSVATKDNKSVSENNAINQPITLSSAAQLNHAGKIAQAASVVYRLAESEKGDRCSPLKMKKLYTLAALLFQNVGDNKKSEVCWQKAGSWHWILLAQTGVITGSEQAIKAASHLKERRPPPPSGAMVPATIALAAVTARAFETCSKAFIELEALPDGEVYADIAAQIFDKHEPVDPNVVRNKCPSCQAPVFDWAASCQSCNMEFAGCSASGNSIFETHFIWKCQQCAHTVSQQEIVLRQTCPVCHMFIK